MRWMGLDTCAGGKGSEVALLQSAAGRGKDEDLYCAAYNGRLDDLRSALRAGANVEYRNSVRTDYDANLLCI
jgi:hypothetical protein